MSDHIGPDCAAGKHPACDGRAWDDETDDITTCDCPCHWDTLNDREDS